MVKCSITVIPMSFTSTRLTEYPNPTDNEVTAKHVLFFFVLFTDEYSEGNSDSCQIRRPAAQSADSV